MPAHKQQREESIYNLIPKQRIVVEKEPVHESKFRDVVREEFQKPKQDHRTFGFAKEPVPKPNEFLKAHEREAKLSNSAQNLQQSERIREKRKPPVPDPIKDRPLLGVKTTKNFVSQNAVDTIMAVPKKPEKNMVDTRKGDKFSLDASGLAPVYVKKKDFGTVPGYILERKEESVKAKEEYENYMAEYFKRGAMRAMNEGEREAILNGLKQNWDELQKIYLSLSVVTDTIPKRMRKEKIETEMKLLEKDIDLLQRHQLIYIAD